MPTITPTIDAEFMALCPSLTDEELQLLRESILAEGCRDRIVCWDTNGTPILDGQHRYEICRGEGIPFEVKLLKLPDRAAARQWIRLNQLARRNLTDAQRSRLRGAYYNEAKGTHGGDRTTQKERASDQSDHLLAQPPTTAQLVASRDGVSPATVRRDARFAKAADAVIEKAPELKEPIEQGTIPKAAVKALAKAPKAGLQKLAKLKGAELRKAATETAKKPKKPKSGTQKRDPRIWQEIEQHLGKALNRVDELHKQFPNKPMHSTLLMQIKQAMKTLDGWKESAR